jgi:tetraacyldisaccharide 4'-kinase
VKVGGPVLAVSGIGNPAAFVGSLAAAGVRVAASHTLGDHHAYTSDDVETLRRLTAKHETIVVTEKDWVKLRRVPGAGGLPIVRSVLGLDFADGHEDALFAMICGRLFNGK